MSIPTRLSTKPLFKPPQALDQSYHLSSVLTTERSAHLASILIAIIITVIVASLWDLLPPQSLPVIDQALLIAVLYFVFYFRIAMRRGAERYGRFESTIDQLQIIASTHPLDDWEKARIGDFLTPILSLEASVGRTTVGHYAQDHVLATLTKQVAIYRGLCSPDGVPLELDEKLTLAVHLHDPNYIKNPPSQRYWATSLDDPVDMWRRSGDFWERQSRLACQDKRRLLVMHPIAYSDLLSFQTANPAYGDPLVRFSAFLHFVKWHITHHFELKLLLKNPEDFRRSAKASTSLSPVLTDFAIFDAGPVFGEAFPPGQHPDDRKVFLIENSEIASKYAHFFESYWSRVSDTTLPRIDSDEVFLDGLTIVNDLAEAESRQSKRNPSSADYQAIRTNYIDSHLFPDARGLGFFNALIQRLEDADTFLAVDVADLKYTNGVAIWRTDMYHRVVKASAKAAAKNKGPCKRLYIVQDGYVLGEADIEELVSMVFAPQIEAGVQIYIAKHASVCKAPHQVRDLLLIDNNLGFGLARWESFSEANIGPEDLINPERLGELTDWVNSWIELAPDKPFESRESVFDALTALRQRR